MAARAVLVRFVGVAMLVYLALVIGVALVRPEFWWLVAISLVIAWAWGFSFVTRLCAHSRRNQFEQTVTSLGLRILKMRMTFGRGGFSCATACGAFSAM